MRSGREVGILSPAFVDSRLFRRFRTQGLAKSVILAGDPITEDREGAMNVSLTPELERFVDGKVESGLYNNASEVVREGLRLLKEHDEIRVKWREQIERGWLQAQRGEVVDGAQAMTAIRERIKTKARKRA